MAGDAGVSVIGRDTELATITAFLADTRARAATLLIEGPAGIGKSTLWLAGCELADRRRLLCRPAQSEQPLAYAALGDLLETVGDEEMDHLPRVQHAALESALLRGATRAEVDPHAVAVAFLAVVRSLARRGPLLLGIDDVQWLDESSARVVEFALRRLDDDPVAVLVSRRTGVTTRLSPERALVGERLDVGPLDLDALDGIIVTQLQKRFLLPVLVQLHRTSEGNPFLALELARAVMRAGGPPPPGEPLPVPADLRALVAERLDAISDSGRTIIDVTALAATPTIGLLERVVGAVAGAAVQEVIAADVLEARGMRLAFTHPLLAAAARTALSPGHAAALHALLADAVEDIEQRARHLALASSGPDAAVVRALEMAAGQALRRGAPAEAADLFELAIRRRPQRADEPPGAHERRVFAAAKAYDLSGNTDRARELVETCFAEAPRTADRAQLAAWLAADELQRQGWTGAVRHRYADALADADDAAVRAGIRVELAWNLVAFGRLAEGSEQADHALADAEQAQDAAPLAQALVIAAVVSFMRGRGCRDDLLSRAEDIVGQGVDVHIEWSPLAAYALQSVWADDFQAGREYRAQLDAYAEQVGDQAMMVSNLWYSTIADLRGGRWDAAAQKVANGDRGAAMLGVTDDSPGMWLRALVWAHAGQLDRAAQEARRGAQLTGTDDYFGPHCEAVLGFLALSVGDYATASSHLRSFRSQMQANGWGHPGLIRPAADAVEALVRTGEIEEAERVTDWLEQAAERSGSAWGKAAGMRCRALLAQAVRDDSEAGRLLEQAVDLHEGLGQPFELARTLLLAGAHHRQQKRKAAARALLERARVIFDGLPAPLWLVRTDEELARLGGRASSPLALTATEHHISRLVAQGLSNRDVAQALFLSPKTVEWNLSKVYRKLGVRSRAELAARWGSIG